MAFAVEYVALFIVGGFGVYLLIFLSGSCWLMISMAHDLKCDLHIVTDLEKPEAKLKNEFSKFVEFHSDAMQLSGSVVFEIYLLLDYFLFKLFSFKVGPCIFKCIPLQFNYNTVVDCWISLWITFDDSNRISKLP